MKLAGSISAKVVVLTIIAVLVAVAVGVTGWSAIGGLRGRVDRLAVVQRVLHNQAEADEGNRAIQYDVLAAVTATTAEGRKTALDDLAEQRETLREAVSENQTLLVGAGAGEQLRRRSPTLVLRWTPSKPRRMRSLPPLAGEQAGRRRSWPRPTPPTLSSTKGLTSSPRGSTSSPASWSQPSGC